MKIERIEEVSGWQLGGGVWSSSTASQFHNWKDENKSASSPRSQEHEEGMKMRKFVREEKRKRDESEKISLFSFPFLAHDPMIYRIL
jgi:hypothetical protein